MSMAELYWSDYRSHTHDNAEVDIMFCLWNATDILKSEKSTGEIDHKKREALMEWLHAIFSDPIMEKVIESANNSTLKQIRFLEKVYKAFGGPEKYEAERNRLVKGIKSTVLPKVEAKEATKNDENLSPTDYAEMRRLGEGADWKGISAELKEKYGIWRRSEVRKIQNAVRSRKGYNKRKEEKESARLVAREKRENSVRTN